MRIAPVPLAVLLLAGLLLSAVASLPARAEGRRPIAVVMSQSSTLEGLSLQELSMAFKNVLRSVRGVDLVPVNLAAESPIRRRFIELVHRCTMDEMKEYWLAVRIKGLGRPPVSYESSATVLDALSRDPHVIGYVEYEPALETRVRCLRIDGKSVTEPSYPLTIAP